MKAPHRIDIRPDFVGLLLLSLSPLGLMLGGCGKSSETDPIVKSAPSSEAPDTESLAENDGIIAVPDGTPEELFDFMEETERKELGLGDDDAIEGDDERGVPKSQAAQGRAIRRVMRVRLEACDKILARQIPEETRTRTIRLRLDALRTLSAIDPDHYAETFDQYLTQLLNGSDRFLSRMAKATQFQSRVNDVLSDGSENSEALLDQLKELLTDSEAGPEVMDATRDAIGWLFQSGQVEVATEGYRLIGERFENSEDQNIADEARMLVSQSTNIHLTRLTQSVSENQPGATERLIAALKELLASSRSDANGPAYAMQTAQFFEFTGRFEQAKQAYQLIRDHYAKDTDLQLAKEIGTSVDLAMKRINLIGSELSLQGVQLNGQSFDWSSYRGKWTLVCFWTTWHQGWPEFSEEIRKTIAEHGTADMQVVAINLDDNRAVLEAYIKDNPLSWTILVNPNPQASGFENPNAIACGVEMIPFVLLVNPDGKVVDIHLAQQRLTDAIVTNVK